MDSLSAISLFVRIAETGSFSNAARELGISKSSASKKMTALEERLGARLINRTTRRLSLTEVGMAFNERAQRILAELEEAEQAVTHLVAEPRGTLRVSAPVTFGTGPLATALADFMTEYPELAVSLDLSDRRVDLVGEGYDVAIRVAELADSSLIARKIARVRRVVCASPDYWKRYGVPDAPRDLKHHNCLVYTFLETPSEWQFQKDGKGQTVRVRGTFHANNGAAIRAAATAGLGVCQSPTFIVGDDLRDGRLVTALDDFEDKSLAVYAVYPHRHHLSAKVRVFVDFLAEHFGPRPYWNAG
ncbi:MAG: LysR family transcriptional regulator [Rhodospirillales bacterium]|nr:LysR family transcriptional regulator [Rhodospirillales bacterium]